MGGTLAAGLAARAHEHVAGLAVIGAPWDFASTRGFAGGIRAMIRAEGPARAERLLDRLGEAFGMVPVSLFQALFALINPLQAALKFQKLARLDPDGPAARLFVALEDWLADGVPMPARAAKDLLVGWQIRNLTAEGELALPRRRGRPGAPSGRQRSCSAARPTPSRRRRWRSRSAGRFPGARTLRPRTGHVGMVVGSAARAEVWRPLGDFLAAHRG